MKELPKAYEPQKYEGEIYKRWEDSGFFNPDVCIKKGICKKNAKHYSVVLPPPNITDKLHLGHVVMVAITDILVRYNRMKGKRTLWIPGTDHAALATQNVVEKKLLKEHQKTRHDLGRKKFLEEIWKFVNETQATIIRQLRKTGASVDWSRLAFTLDEQRQTAVRQMFVDMYNEGVIYRGYRMVNWCPRCHSTLSDDEVEYKEQNAKFYTFKYSKDFPFSISTTRPETKLGDTAVAVNPKDKRYKKYIGKIFNIDFCGVKLNLKIISDKNVDMNFGTGALGVTPAHSFVDYEMAQKNKLEIKKIIDESGKMIGVGKYTGLPVLEAREMVASELRTRNLLEKEEEIKNNLSICSRCDTAIEPMPSKQWFVSVDKKLKRLGNKSLKQKGIEAAESNKIKFTPLRFKKRYLDWMKNLHDWCISRQIWFGHQMPVWYKKGSTVEEKDVYVGIEAPKDIKNWEQEQDVLDTWFSSGMWTFSTMGWPSFALYQKRYRAMAGKPAKVGDLKAYHPTNILETGYEIITLWVSRMVMMSFFALGEIPFENVYLHGMVLDKNGKKMSKSKGNGVDPLEMIEKYGTDAVRLSLIVGNTPGNDTRMSEEKIADFRNFTNKLWNICRFMILNIEKPKKDLQMPNPKTLADKWILSRLAAVGKELAENIEKLNFSCAGEFLRDFTWNDLADWYLEAAKIECNKSEILNYILNAVLKLWHPFMPFVTEKIWLELYGTDDFLMIQKWPELKYIGASVMNDFVCIKDIVTGIRSIRADIKIEPVKKLDSIISAGNREKLLQENSAVIAGLARLADLKISKKAVKTKTSVGFIAGQVEVFIELSGVVDFKKEKERIEKEIKNVEPYAAQLEKKLGNKAFLSGAPEAVVNSEQVKLEEAKLKLEKLYALYRNITI
jgi:valyl-tRNA synthetase